VNRRRHSKTTLRRQNNCRCKDEWGMILFTDQSRRIWPIWSNFQTKRRTATPLNKSSSLNQGWKRKSMNWKSPMKISALNLSTSMNKICNLTSQAATLFHHFTTIRHWLWLGWYKGKDRSLRNMMKRSYTLFGPNILLAKVDHFLWTNLHHSSVWSHHMQDPSVLGVS